ncbi:hypothetical protein PUR50_16605, partial [Enterobacter hormaechei subsp. steigerwaltii]|nr:hypothetical protein [Enterobacter hormaechei subsp. steigerwaltii]
MDDKTIKMAFTGRKVHHLHFIVARNALSECTGMSAMTDPDFNLLIALDILLSEASVAGAARRLNLSTSA